MKPVRIFRHVDCEGPGYFAEFLARRDIPYQLIAVDQGARVSPVLNDVSGLVFMGGGMSVNDDLPWINEELQLIRRAADARVPVLGHCLGGQLISKALGGVVTRNPVRELGWFDVSRVPGPAADAWLGGLPSRFETYHWHGETFSLPEGAHRILENEACRHQAFVYDRLLALQCHVEMTAAMVHEWAERFGDALAKPEPTVQSAAQMLEGVDARVAALQRVADVLYARWLQGLRD